MTHVPEDQGKYENVCFCYFLVSDAMHIPFSTGTCSLTDSRAPRLGMNDVSNMKVSTSQNPILNREPPPPST